MQCPNCHAKHQKGLFCTKCGHPLNDDTCDMTRVMPPIAADQTPIQAPAEEALEQAAPPTAAADTDEAAPTDAAEETPTAAPISDASATSDTSAEALLHADHIDHPQGDDFVLDATDPYQLASEEQASADAPTHTEEDTESLAEEEDDVTALALLDEDTEASAAADALAEADAPASSAHPRRKKLLTILALVVGIGLAALSAVYLFTNTFNTEPSESPTEKIKNASTITPDKGVAEDAIVGHWRHYNTGSVIEKIGTARYRWTISGHPYQLKFKDNQYIYEDEKGNIYTFALVNSDRIQLVSSEDASGGLISNPIFESGYIAGRVGQDGTMTKNLSVNPEAFNIVGKTYAELAGIYGPGSLSVVGDDQYLIFRAKGGNFAVQFAGETVPLKQEEVGYTVQKLTNTPAPNTDPITPTFPEVPTPPDSNNNDNNDNNAVTPNSPSIDSNESDKDKEKDKEYKVEIPDMPTFPSNSAVATGVVWADLGFFINNAPDTMTVENLSAVLGIALEVGTAPGNESGFAFYGMNDGYFAGTYGINDHTYYISGYGSQALSADKTIIFIQQVS